MSKNIKYGTGKRRGGPRKKIIKETKVGKYTTKKDSSVVQEDLDVYEITLTEVVSDLDEDIFASVLLANAMNKPESQMTPLEKREIAREGIRKKDLEKLKDKTELDYDKLAKALSVTRATLINKKGEEKFNSTLSERIVALADLYSYGYEVFEDEARFNRWMFRPNKALGGQPPYELIDSQFGREELRNIIGRIAYGVYS